MRILIFNWRDISHPHAGGAEVYTHEVAKEWVASGHEVTLFCGRHKSQATREMLDGVAVVRRGSRYSVYWHATRFYKRIAHGQFDLILDEANTRPFHVHRYSKEVPVVMLVHQMAKEIWFHEFSWPFAVIGRYALEPYWVWKCRAAKVVAVSESTAESLHERGLQHVSVVAEGMSLPVYALPRKKEEFPTVIFCGRLASNKRPDHAIEAFGAMKNDVPDAQMWVVGTGPMEDQLRRNAPAGVHFWGRVSHEKKFELMARAHMLVSTSVREGWGLVVSEAAAVGTPSIGYDIPGLRDSIPASGGVLTSPDKATLAAAMALHLPIWFRCGARTNAGGVQSWSAVAAGILAVAGPDLREPGLRDPG